MRARLLILMLAALLPLTACKYGENSSPAPNRIVLGYYTGDSDSSTSAQASGTPLNEVAQDLISVDASGGLHGNLDSTLLTSDVAQGKLSYATVSNFGATDFDADIAHGAMVTHRGTTILNILTLAKNARLTGINLDFEGLSPADRGAYTAFVTSLAEQLHAQGSMLILSVPAKSMDDPSDSWTGAFDYAALGQKADFMQVMTYDEHVPGQGPGPVAGIDWMTADLDYAISQISPDKILLGLPAYGYDFDVTHNTGVQVEWKDFASLAASIGVHPVWDPVSESEHFDYTASDGSMHQVWYETTRGIQDKAHLAVSLDLAGVSMWALGFENDAFWRAVSAGLN
ncbi:MAG TPA: glycosyl hydrolase family 18 protein [Gammaproteobacteria bacterium]